MSDYPSIVCTLYGTKSDGAPSEVGVAVRPLGPITRTIGLQGDTLVLLSPLDWPEEWDRSRPFRLVFGDDTPDPAPAGSGLITLGGYMARMRRPVNWGTEHNLPPPPPPPPPPPMVAPTHHAIEVVFETIPGLWRDGRGGLVTYGTRNRLGPDGRVDSDHPDYRTNQELVDALLDALRFAHAAAPAGLNTAVDGVTPLTAPGPLDWGNARAVPELEAILSRLGWAAVYNNAGDEVSVVRLARAGETFTPTSLVDDHAEPYSLTESEGVRPDRIVITSGRTRTTAVSERTLDPEGDELPLTWCRYDEATGAWVDEAAATQLAAFQAGPVGADNTTRAFAGAFTAVRLHEDEREAFGAFVTIPEAPASSGFGAFARSPVMVWMRGAVADGAGQYANVPDAMDDPLRVEGAQAIPGEGVFTLPTLLRAVRMPSERGGHMDADHLGPEDLVVRFCHELDTGDQLLDYYVSGWQASVTAGVISVAQMDGAALLAALADPLVVKVEAPFLRRIMAWEPGAAEPTPTNDDALDEIAREIALQRVAASMAESGTITLRGVHDVAPGALGGSVSGVSWQFDGAWMTVLSINQHETPASWWDELEFEAGRSIGAGVDRLVPAGSSVALADIRAGSTPGDTAGSWGGGAAGAPEAASGTRGRERAIVSPPARHGAPEPASCLPGRAEASWLDAIITGSSGGSGNRWTYAWSEAKWDGTAYVAVSGGMSSATHGPARNLVEVGNDGDDVEAPGWDTESEILPVTVQPISAGTCVRLTGPRHYLGDPTWFFECANAVAFEEASSAAVTRFKARIGAAALIDGQDYGWLYDWVEMEHTSNGWVPRLGGRSSGGVVASDFTADAGADTIDPADPVDDLADGAAVQLTTTDTLPAPLATATDYYARWATQGGGDGPYTLYPTSADALAGTNAINITTAGSGVHTLTSTGSPSGKARNLNEHRYGASPAVFAPGYAAATIPAGYEPVAVSGEPIVTLEGPYGELEGESIVNRYYFSAENAVDGDCP